MKAIAKNEVGFGFVSQAPLVRQTFKLFPTLGTTVPLKVYEFRGNTLIWKDQKKFTSVSIEVTHLPFVAVGKTLDLIVRKGSQTLVTTAIVRMRVALPPYSFEEDPLGVNVQTTLSVTFPPFASGEGQVEMDVFTPAYPAKLVTVFLAYFEYPKPRFSRILDSSGTLAGGYQVDILISESVRAESRYGAGIVNFLSTETSRIQVVFNDTNVATGLTRILSISPDPEYVKITMTVTVPGNDIEGHVPVGLKINGIIMTMDTPIVFRFRGPWIALAIPRDGLTTGNQAASFLVQDAGAMVLTNLTVTINNLPCTVPTLPAFSDKQMLIELTTPQFSASMAGSTHVVITLKRSGFSDLVIHDREAYTLVIPPDPVLLEASIRVQGRVAGQVWVSRTAATSVQLTVRYFIPLSGSTLSVKIGGWNASAVTFESTGPIDDIRKASTTVSFLTPTNKVEGKYSIVVLSSTGSRAESSAGVIEFVDLSRPRIDSVSQSESRASGGAVVLVGVTGFCKGLSMTCVPSFAAGASFEMPDNSTKAAVVLGAVSLTAWQRNFLPQVPSFGDFINGLGPAYSAQFNLTVSSLEANVKANSGDGVTTAANSFVLAVLTPTVAAASSANLIISSSNGNTNTFSPFQFTAAPEGGARVTSFLPSEGLANNRGRLFVTLENFQPVYRRSEVLVLFGAEVLDSDDVRIESSSLASSTVSMIYPNSAPVLRTVSLTPGVMNVSTLLVQPLTSNKASFKFNFIDTRPKLVLSNPFEVYSTGGDTITAFVLNLGVLGLKASEIAVSVQLADTAAMSVTTGVAASFVQSPAPPPITKTATVSFPAPAVMCTAPDGCMATVTLRYVNGGAVSFAYKYLSTPTGAAIMAFSPSTGESSGGFAILAYLTNMKQVSAASAIKVKVAGVQLAATKVTSVISNRVQTLVTFIAPFQSSGGNKQIQVWETGREANTATAAFSYIDVNKAAILYSDPAQGDSELTTLVNVGVENLGSIISSPAGLSLAVTSAISGVGVTVDRIIGSTTSITHLLLRVSASPVVISTNTKVLIAIKPDRGTPLKTSTVTFTYLPAGQPRVVSFSPSSAYEVGLVEMRISVANFPSGTSPPTAGDVLVVFIMGVSNVTASFLTYKKDSGTRAAVEITAIIPRGTVGSLTPQLLVQSKSVLVSLGSTFTYNQMPKVALTSIVPSRGKIVDITAVGITLNNFPAPLAAFDIVISVNKIEARVVAFARADASLDARAVQTMIVYAEMPCCSDDIVAGKVEVWAYHRSFPRDASPPAALFEYYNPDMPSVIKVEGDTQGPSAQGNNVKMSMMTLVRLTLLNVPLSVTRVDQIKATVPGVTASAALVTVPIKFLSVQTSGQADVRLQLPASQSSGVSVVTLNFPSDLTTTFEVRYYNDLQPVITSVDPTVGKWTGGSTLRISVANFPVMTSPDQATVKFGLEGASFGTIVSILKSSGLETQLIVLTPAYFGALQAGTVEVQVGVTSVQNSNKAAVNGRFSFEKLAPSLESVSISKGSSFGGDQLRINLKNFPAGTTASAVVVEFDTSFVDASQITIPLSNTDRTQVVVTTPPFDPPSTVYCRVYLRASGRGSSDRLKFSYTFIDTRLPSMHLPVPRFACIGRPSVSKTFFVLLFADLSKPANYTHPTPIVTYAPTEGTATPWTVTSYQASTHEAAAMVVASTATSVAASSSGEITMLAGSKSVSFAFELRDCAQVALVSASPRKGVSLGGGDVQVRIANMPINEQLANGGITASFGSTSGQVVTAQKVVPDPTIYPDAPTNEWDVYLTITSPAIDMIGSVTVTLKTGSAQVTFEYASWSHAISKSSAPHSNWRWEAWYSIPFISRRPPP